MIKFKSLNQKWGQAPARFRKSPGFVRIGRSQSRFLIQALKVLAMGLRPNRRQLLKALAGALGLVGLGKAAAKGSAGKGMASASRFPAVATFSYATGPSHGLGVESLARYDAQNRCVYLRS